MGKYWTVVVHSTMLLSKADGTVSKYLLAMFMDAASLVATVFIHL